ncbi:MAG: rod shape-determining protein RodA [Burkholderiaceae bacterium]|nr:rod shape-determining protein RodA [Chromatiaceae bacterium]MBP7966288.1 rod shape-determining protein RodA [Burkholderiaceae bacterium]
MAIEPINAGLDRVPMAGPASLSQRLHLDLPLVFALLLAAGYGLLVLFSAIDQDPKRLEAQLLRLGLAFGVMIVVAQIPPRLWRRLAVPLYVAGVLMLVAVLAVGEIGKGAQRWLDLGFLRFQPSELLKLGVPLMLAWFLALRPLPPGGWRTLLAAILTAVPAVLIARQPDLGTALLVGSAGAFVLFLAGLSWRFIALLVAIAAALAPLLWSQMLDYQKNRVLTLFDPESDPLGTGYHIIQSKIAIGSGGVYGKGWGLGTQSHLEFLPERSTDFIFAVLGEELGLFGVLGLLGIYLFIIFRGLYIASQSPDAFGRLLAGGLTLVFFVYLFVNTGMVSGLLPVVGVPLPLVSYGGTSMVTILAGFGLIMAVHTHRERSGR